MGGEDAISEKDEDSSSEDENEKVPRHHSCISAQGFRGKKNSNNSDRRKS